MGDLEGQSRLVARPCCFPADTSAEKHSHFLFRGHGVNAGPLHIFRHALSPPGITS